MPFDGTGLQSPAPFDTGIFPIWSRHGGRLWVKACFRRERRERITEALLRAPAPADRDETVEQLLHDARDLIENPRYWMRGTYRWFRGRRCAVGALRAVARRVKDPVPVWAAHAYLITVARSRGFTNVEAMNDRSSHAAVLRAFDEAIALAHTAAVTRFERLAV
ncbi:MAG TPA: hypothetical protein VGR91_04100 [Stellaceae bacterium]|nr:hypothetical protein [Stellaceae bacterium]